MPEPAGALTPTNLAAFPGQVKLARRAPHAPPSVSDHELLRCIGPDGAFGEVWLARSVMGVYRAVKIVYRDRFKNDGPYDMEFEGLRQFHDVSREHDGFVDILHVSRNDDAKYFYYVMELADDISAFPHRRDAGDIDPDRYTPCTLASILGRRRRLPAAECIEVALDLAAALVDLHRRLLVHRDIKPSNIILIKGRARLGDIGLVGEVIDQPLPIVGTPGYMDEDVHGTTKGDLYGLGKLLYVMATGRRADDWPEWPDRNEMVEDVDGLRELNEVFLKACQPKRSRRYQSAEEFRDDLLLLKAGRSVKRLVELEQFVALGKRYSVALLMMIALGCVILWQWLERGRQEAKLLQRHKSSLLVAYGTRAMEERDLLGAAAWFAGGLALDPEEPARQRTHRLRLASVLRDVPTIGQMWFRSPTLNYAEYGARRREVLASDASGRWNVWDLARGEPLHAPFGDGRLGERAHLSPRGDFAVTTVYNASPQLWEVATGKRRGILQTNAVSIATFSADGARLITGGNGRTVTVWDVNTGASLLSLKHSARYVMDVAVSPDNRWLAAGGSDGTTALWNLANPTNPPVILAGHGKDAWIYSVTFSPDGRTLATASKDWDVRLWDAETGMELGPRLHHADIVRSVRFSPDGRSLVTAGWDFAAHIWDVDSRQCRFSLPHNSKVMHAEFNEEGRQVLTAAFDGIIRFWNLRPARPLPDPETVAVSGDGGSLIRFSADTLEFFATSNQVILGTARLPDRSATNFQISHDGRSGVALDLANANQLQARRWTRDNQRSPRVLLDAGLTNVVLAHNGSQMAAWVGARVVVLDLITGRTQSEFTVPGKRLTGIAFNPAGDLLAVAAGTNLFLHETTSGRVVGSPMTNSLPIRQVQFSPNGRRILVACSDQTLAPGHAQLWDAETRRPVGPLLQHRDGVLYATFSPDGRSIITCGEDNSALLWDAATGRRRTPFLRHRGHVFWAAFSADGRWVVTGADDGAKGAAGVWRLWDAESGEPLMPPSDPVPDLLRVRFAGAWRLLVESTGGVARLMDLPYDDRDSGDLTDMAQLLSAQQVHQSGNVMPQSRAALEAIFHRLLERYPEDFSVRPE